MSGTEIRWPGPTDRLAVIGRTGSGKTRAASWHLSRANFHQMPWLIIDAKGEELFSDIRGVREMGVDDPIPKKPGLYHVRVLPGEGENLDNLMWRAWHRGNVGLYFDEGYMVADGKGDSRAFRALLTQGRSKHVPMIILSQRPVWMSRFVFTQATFFQIFHMHDQTDIKTLAGIVPLGKRPLPENYHSLWYDVGANRLVEFMPVPGDAEILDTFKRRLTVPRKIV